MLRRTSRTYNTRHVQLLKCHQQTLHRRVKVPKCLEFRYLLVSFSDSCPLVALSALFGLRKRCLNLSQRKVVTFDISLLLLVGHTITSQLGDRSKGNMEGTLVTQRNEHCFGQPNQRVTCVFFQLKTALFSRAGIGSASE